MPTEIPKTISLLSHPRVAWNRTNPLQSTQILLNTAVLSTPSVLPERTNFDNISKIVKHGNYSFVLTKENKALGKGNFVYDNSYSTNSPKLFRYNYTNDVIDFPLSLSWGVGDYTISDILIDSESNKLYLIGSNLTNIGGNHQNVIRCSITDSGLEIDNGWLAPTLVNSPIIKETVNNISSVNIFGSNSGSGFVNPGGIYFVNNEVWLGIGSGYFGQSNNISAVNKVFLTRNGVIEGVLRSFASIWNVGEFIRLDKNSGRLIGIVPTSFRYTSPHRNAWTFGSDIGTLKINGIQQNGNTNEFIFYGEYTFISKPKEQKNGIKESLKPETIPTGGNSNFFNDHKPISLVTNSGTFSSYIETRSYLFLSDNNYKSYSPVRTEPSTSDYQSRALSVGSVSIDFPPTLSLVSIASNNSTTNRAKVGDVITVSITASESITAPLVTIAGQSATVSGSGTSWLATYTATSSTSEGNVAPHPCECNSEFWHQFK